MEFELTETQKDIQKAAREFAEKEFDSDLALELEKEQKFPKSIFEKACQLGFIGIEYPESYGGQSFGLFEDILVIEEFTKKDSGIGIALSLTDLGASVLLKHGDEKQKRELLIPITQGKGFLPVALLESMDGEGQTPMIIKRRDGSEGYLIAEGKSWVTYGSLSQFIIVLNRGSNFGLLIEKGWKGVKITGLKKLMGMRISPTEEMVFTQVEIPEGNALLNSMEEQDPLSTYLQVYRIKTSGQALGISQGAFDQALKHAKEREQFGRKIAQFQGIQFMLADLYTQIEAARNLVYRAACGYDAKSPDLEKLSLVTKLFTTEVAVKTTIDAIQIHGGVGLMKEYSMERRLRDAKTIQNLKESNLVQRALISRKIVSI